MPALPPSHFLRLTLTSFYSDASSLPPKSWLQLMVAPNQILVSSWFTPVGPLVVLVILTNSSLLTRKWKDGDRCGPAEKGSASEKSRW